MLPSTLQFLLVMIASSINERMQKRLDYKTEEVLVLKEILRAVTGRGGIGIGVGFSGHCAYPFC